MPSDNKKKPSNKGNTKQGKGSSDPATARPATSDNSKPDAKPSDNHPDNPPPSKDKADHASKEQRKPTVIAPQPGKYPVIFDADTGKPTKDCPFVINVGQVTTNHGSIHEQLAASTNYNRYVAELADGRTRPQVLQFEREFVGAAVLTTAQNVVRSFKENGRDIAGMSNVDKANIVHITPVREISAQYGIVPDSNTGQMFVPLDIKTTCDKIVRAASAVTTFEGDNIADICAAVASRAWAPISGEDSEFRYTCRNLLQYWLDRNGFNYILVKRNLPLFTGVDPPWLQLIPEENLRPQISWLFAGVNIPRQVNTWVRILNDIPDGFYEGQRVSRPLNRHGELTDWVATDLGFGLNYKDLMRTIVDAWAPRAPALSTLFHVAGNADCTKEGTLAQFAYVVGNGGTITYTNATSNTKTEASLAVCFQPVTFVVDTRTPYLAIGYSEVQLREKQAKWVQQCLKG
jgi:hypothetical protein